MSRGRSLQPPRLAAPAKGAMQEASAAHQRLNEAAELPSHCGPSACARVSARVSDVSKVQPPARREPHRKGERDADARHERSNLVGSLRRQQQLLHLHPVAVAQVTRCSVCGTQVRRRYRQAERAAAVLTRKQRRRVPARRAGALGARHKHATRLRIEQQPPGAVQAALPARRRAVERGPARAHRAAGGEANERSAAKQRQSVSCGIEPSELRGACGGQVQRAARQQQLRAACVRLQCEPLRRCVGSELC